MLKIVYKNVYAHRSNLGELAKYLTDDQELTMCRAIRNNETRNTEGKTHSNYTVIKYNTDNNNVSLIECEDWDKVNEPVVGDSYCYKTDGSVKKITGGTRVYHSRENFVSNRYKGFDLEAAKRRTVQLNSIPGIEEVKNKIGNKEYWHTYLKENNIEI